MTNERPPTVKPIAESYWVIEDRLLAGKYPGGKTASEIHAAWERCSTRSSMPSST
jgi:hypothetical protein